MTAKEIYIVLDNVRYKNNVGAIFRVADAYRIKKIFLCRKNKEWMNENQVSILKKISRGAIDFVDWQLYQDSVEAVSHLKNSGVQIVSLAVEAKTEISEPELALQFPLAIVFGSEGPGVNQQIIKQSDKLLKIPMAGKGQSLNVASSVAIVAYKIREIYGY